jgi:thiol-disulfide isomerase/thioredoxin
MPYATALAAVAAILTLLNLLLTFGVIRRLREHSERLSRMAAGALPGDPVIQPGSAIGTFAAVTLDGEAVAHDRMGGETLVGFFSPTCQPCKAMLPKFIEHARRFPGGRDAVLAVVVGQEVVVGQGTEVGDYVARLAPHARIVVESHDGAVATAFEVAGLPAMCLVDGDGTVIASGMTTAALPAYARHG